MKLMSSGLVHAHEATIDAVFKCQHQRPSNETPFHSPMARPSPVLSSFKNPRCGTIDATVEHLTDGHGLGYRYRAPDGLFVDEG